MEFIKLTTPSVVVNNSGLASWVAIENASGYAYKINGGTEVKITGTSVQLRFDDTIIVKALGNGENYLDSDYSSELKFSPLVLSIGQFNANFDSYTSTFVKVKGFVYAKDNYGLYIIDENQDTVYAKYNHSNLQIEIGQVIEFIGTSNLYYSLPQLVVNTAIIYDVNNYDLTVNTTSIEQVIADNTSQSAKVFDHYVYRVTGVITQEDTNLFIVDGDYKLQIKASTCIEEMNVLTSYINKEIKVNVVLSDCFSTTGIFRVHPLVGDDAQFEEVEEEIRPTTGELIQVEYNALKAGTTTNHTNWDFDATIVDMTATAYNSTYNTYNLKFIASVDGILIGVYNGQVNGAYPANIDGLAVGTVVNIKGVIAEKYTMTSGSYSTNIEFSMPEISWEPSDKEDDEIENENKIDINFISINDTHGAFIDSSEGYSIGRVATLVESLENKNGEYIFIHAGDAFQGSYICGETYGLAMIEALNASGLDCFVIGNHEFDWGIDKIARYKDGNLSNGEANFPFLGANIYLKGTTTRPSWIDAYTIIEQDGLKVGIIGIMGDSQESSILTRYVKDYDFVNPINIVKTTASYLRDTAGCDVVVVAAHDYEESTNNQIAALSGSSRIDAIFCAHTHQNIYDVLTRSDSKTIPVVQCYHKNNNAAEVILSYDENNEYTSFTVQKYNPSSYSIDSDVQVVINKYQDLIDESNEVIGTTSSSLSKSKLGGYAVDAMLNDAYSDYDFEDVDIAVMNTGGVRATINSGDITRAEVFEVFPFNNSVVLVNMSGKLIKEFLDQNASFMYYDVVDSIGSYSSFNDSTIYQMAVIDYVFEGTRYTQFSGLEYIQTEVVLRDLLMVYLEQAF